MKTNTLKMKLPVKTLASLCALTLLLACKPAQDTTIETPEAPEAATPAAPATPEAVPAAATAPAAPADPAAPAEAAPAAPATGTVRYDAQPTGSKAKMEGTSTIHDWSMETAVIGGFMEADANFPESALTDPQAAKPKVEIFMPVRSFKSSYKKMDEVMQEHMNESKHKRISYKLTELKPKSAAGTTGAIQFDAVGELTINGTTKTTTMPVTIEKKDGKMRVTGSTALKMTEYGVKPPAPTIFGMPTIKTGDDLKITFDWVSAPKA